ncbi:hypothetical protein [Streptacidiphilus rugosus]|uniref:hypothetical protein n=1 Tax=Streptacidiphilus rugosus TaxID=405783 RepID=UPI00056627E1|nr:hypothetical protein [Streptacidiphilus rugosus]
MYGPPPLMAPAPPARRGATVGRALAWFVIAVVLIGGVGIFAFVPLGVLAVRRRQRRDLWLTLGAFVYAVVGCVAVSAQHDSNHPGVLVSLLSVGMLGQGIAATVYYVVCDLRPPRLRPVAPMHLQQPPHAGPFAGHGSTPDAGPVPYGSPAHRPLAQPPIPEQSYRLGQVRAELDELSDYLRKERDR